MKFYIVRANSTTVTLFVCFYLIILKDFISKIIVFFFLNFNSTEVVRTGRGIRLNIRDKKKKCVIQIFIKRIIKYRGWHMGVNNMSIV